jgi:putative ABC transport system permease protein
MKSKNTKKIFTTMRLKLALRSVTRHYLRSFLSIGMIAGAVCSIILFQGIADYFLEALKTSASENQYGNMQIAKEKFWNPGKEARKERLLDIDEIKQITLAHPEIVNVSGRLSFYGLVSNGDLSLGGRIHGIDTQKEPSLIKSLNISSGKFFTEKDAKEAMLGKLLAKQLSVNTGDNITVLTNTVDGVMNAIDLTVSGIFSAGLDEVDSQTIYVPLEISQKIIDTPKIDIAVLKFAKLSQSEQLEGTINRELKSENPTLKARSWRNLAVLYRQVEKFYKVQNLLIEMILLALMFLGILNSVSMTVVERTGEIGTLRSFGETRSEIISQFILESLVIAFLGSIVGTICSIGIINIIQVSNISTEMPGASIPMPVKINFLSFSVIYASFLAFFTAVIATYIPARRAANMNIVDALRKNI